MMAMNMVGRQLEGRNVLLTGAAGHLGQAIAWALARAGAVVWLNGRSAVRIHTLASRLTAEGFYAEPAVFDVRDQDGRARFFDQFGDRPLGGLVNNAYAGAGGTIISSTVDAYAEGFALVVGASHALLVQAMPALRRGLACWGDASIVNIASMYALVSPDLRLYGAPEASNPPFYGAAKAALLQWTRYAACEFGPEGIRVNAVSPGPFPADAVHVADPEFIRQLEHKVPLGRTGRAHEIGEPIVFLISSGASFITGANLVVDGGWTSW